jgi:hypothetical protein
MYVYEELCSDAIFSFETLQKVQILIGQIIHLSIPLFNQHTVTDKVLFARGLNPL